MQAHLSLKKGAQPRFHWPRSVPFAIKQKANKELDHLETSGVVRKVEHAEWAAPTRSSHKERWVI